MRKLAAFLPLALIMLAAPAQAGNPGSVKCRSFDTANVFTAPMAVLGGCGFTTGPAGVAYITAEAEVVCNGTQSTRLLVGTGASTFPGTIQGSTFAGTISGGVLTVPTVRPAGWYLAGYPALIFGFGAITATNPNGGNPPWLIQAGQTLNGDGMQGHPGVTITGQLTSGEALGVLGGAGTYSISDPALVTENTANGFFSLKPLPGGMTAITPTMHQSGCKQGYVVTSMAGVFSGQPNSRYWVGLEIASDNNSGWSSWVNSQFYILFY
jgi:hypothetical protein